MKRIYQIPAVAILILVAILFWDPIIDFLPIDQSGWRANGYGNCYLDEDGDPVAGWHTVDGTEYYFHPDTRVLHTGWADRSDVRCYVVDGLACSGWTDTPEGRFYLQEDGTLRTGWMEDNGRRIYLNEQGFPATGWVETAEGRFYLDEDGAPCTGIVETDQGTYCFNDDGSLQLGWFEADNKRYFAGEDGSLHTGWLEYEGNRYYLDEDGAAAVGKRIIDHEAYFFSSTGIQFILVNPWHELPKDFSVDLEFVESAGVNPVCRADLEQMLADCRAAGLSPRILSGYRSIRDQEYNFNVAVGRRVAMGYAYKTAYDYVRKNIAVPGTSEHHLGLAFDIVDSRHPYLEESQEKTETQKWLMENSWKYGFILRYPEGTTEITGIVYEPWHYRYLGREMAAEIHKLGITLEEYVDMLTADGTTCGGTVTPEEK